MLEDKGMMVLDSGGQYLNGTTDITRTIVFNEINEEERTDFTLVLKAHIALASTKFRNGATGSNLMCWQENLYGNLVLIINAERAWSRLLPQRS